MEEVKEVKKWEKGEISNDRFRLSDAMGLSISMSPDVTGLSPFLSLPDVTGFPPKISFPQRRI